LCVEALGSAQQHTRCSGRSTRQGVVLCQAACGDIGAMLHCAVLCCTVLCHAMPYPGVTPGVTPDAARHGTRQGSGGTRATPVLAAATTRLHMGVTPVGQLCTFPFSSCIPLQYATRTCLAQAGLPTPRNARISAPSDVQAAADHVGFPSVIKPVSGAASIGVIRVNDMEQLQKAYERVVRDLSRAKVRCCCCCFWCCC
jgi:hypothetical protein